LLQTQSESQESLSQEELQLTSSQVSVEQDFQMEHTTPADLYTEIANVAFKEKQHKIGLYYFKY
jgi:hypothetical protein